jgi:hypothetical protein
MPVEQAALVERPASQTGLALFGTDDPVEIIEKAVRVADALKAILVQKNLIKRISSKDYPVVEAWQTLAVMLGLTTFCEWSHPVEGGWEARVVVRSRNGMDIGSAEAQCTRTENMWKSREDFALRSMSQTRATAKSLRSLLGFIMVLAGYQATPAEEMISEVDDSRKAKPSRPPTMREVNVLADNLGFDPTGMRQFCFDHVPSTRDLDKRNPRVLKGDEIAALMAALHEYERVQDEASRIAASTPPQAASASVAPPDEQGDPFADADAAGLDYDAHGGYHRSEGDDQDGRGEPEPTLSQEQHRKLQAMCNSRFKRDRAARLKWAGEAIFRTVDTFDTLTVREATRLIEALEHDEAMR